MPSWPTAAWILSTKINVWGYAPLPCWLAAAGRGAISIAPLQSPTRTVVWPKQSMSPLMKAGQSRTGAWTFCRMRARSFLLRMANVLKRDSLLTVLPPPRCS
jgi:hypothetical protein